MTYANVVSTIALLLAATGGVSVATGAIPGSGGEIDGCYKEQSGQLRVVDAESGGACGNNEVPIAWSQQGPAGPAGPQGDKGDKGDAGEPGTFTGEFESPNGLSSISVQDTGITLESPGGRLELTPAGAVLRGTLVRLGGGTACEPMVKGTTTLVGGGGGGGGAPAPPHTHALPGSPTILVC